MVEGIPSSAMVTVNRKSHYYDLFLKILRKQDILRIRPSIRGKG